jgi:hypothetical protein
MAAVLGRQLGRDGESYGAGANGAIVERELVCVTDKATKGTASDMDNPVKEAGQGSRLPDALASAARQFVIRTTHCQETMFEKFIYA